jgi:hypothetical protein
LAVGLSTHIGSTQTSPEGGYRAAAVAISELADARRTAARGLEYVERGQAQSHGGALLAPRAVRSPPPHRTARARARKAGELARYHFLASSQASNTPT